MVFPMPSAAKSVLGSPAVAPSRRPDGTRPPAVELVEVTRDYTLGWLPRRQLRAVDGVNLRIEAGEVFGLLGPNRAGKTTLVKMLLSLCQPTRGQVHRLGRPASDRATLARVGYMHENHAFPRYLTARELLGYYGAMTLLPYDRLGPRVEELLIRVGLADRADSPISTFSKGMVQRLGLAQALLGDPELLVLDEPTEGLDLAGRRLLREVVAQLKQAGRTVLLVSHVLPEVELLCDRVAVLRQGQLRYLGALAGLTVNGRSFETALQELYES
jgi:ABC-2 type transport system ATP-binding protein